MSALGLLFRTPACPGLAQSPEYTAAREGQISALVQGILQMEDDVAL